MFNFKSCFGSCLKAISVGKYRTILYHKDKENYSSKAGGIITILCAIFLITYGFYLVNEIFNREKY
jgi:hypothetical protein